MRPYEKGQRVVMTVLGYERLVKPWTRRVSARSTIGVCVRREPHTLVVLRDGHKRPEMYHPDFWEIAQ